MNIVRYYPKRSAQTTSANKAMVMHKQQQRSCELQRQSRRRRSPFLLSLLLFLLGVTALATAFVAPKTSARSIPQYRYRNQVLSFLSFKPNTGVTTALSMAKKKKKGGGSPGGGGGSNKLQVKLLKQVPGTGQAGQVVRVTPAFFNNKLRPTGAACIISDDEVEQDRVAAQEVADALQAQARAVQERIEEQKEGKATLVITRKAGPNGQLFGGVTAKLILEELRQQLCDDGDDGCDVFFDRRDIKITSFKDSDGKKLRGDIKHTGDYSATVSLTKECSATFTIEVEASAN